MSQGVGSFAELRAKINLTKNEIAHLLSSPQVGEGQGEGLGRRRKEGPMRLKKSEREFIAYQRVCRVATVSEDGRPHNVPVCPILEGDRIYFGSASDGVKVRNVRATGRVALAYDEYTEAWSGLRGILIWGAGRVIEAGPSFRKIQKLLYRRYPQYEKDAPLDEEGSVIIEVTPTRTFSWGL